MPTCQTTEVGPVRTLVRGMNIHFLGELPFTLEKLSCPTKEILRAPGTASHGKQKRPTLFFLP